MNVYIAKLTPNKNLSHISTKPFIDIVRVDEIERLKKNYVITLIQEYPSFNEAIKHVKAFENCLS